MLAHPGARVARLHTSILPWFGWRVAAVGLVAILALSASAGTALGASGDCTNGIAVPDPATNPGLVADCAWLLSLRDELRGTADLDWSDSTNIATWDGITVASVDGALRVVSLDREREELDGSIPYQLGNLSKLQHLYLEGNDLSGRIPTEFGNLSELQHLSLHENQLSGSIPTEFGNLSELQHLSLHENQLSGSIPSEFGNLSELQHLSLYENQLSGSIPSEFRNLSKLQRLSLHENQLSGSIPTEFGNLSELQHLSLYGNQLSGSIPSELGNVAKLEDLSLYNNQLSGSIPSGLGNLSELVDLSLGTNQLSGSIPSELGNLAKLRNLNLRRNQLSGSIPTELENLSELQFLSLNDNQLSGSIPTELGGLNSLEHLYLSCNLLSGTVPTALETIPRLSVLRLGGNQIDGPIPSGLVAAVDRWEGPWFCGGIAMRHVDEGTPAGVAIGAPLMARTQDNRSLTYSLVSSNDADPFAIDAATGQLRTLASLDYDNPSDSNGNNLYEFQVKANDNLGSSDSEGAGNVRLFVRKVQPARRSPKLDVNFRAPPGPVAVGETLSLTITVSNAGNVKLRGVFWGSTTLGVERNPIGDGDLDPDESAEVAATFGPVSNADLPGPLTIDVFADSNLTHAEHATRTVAVVPSAQPEPSGSAGGSRPSIRDWRPPPEAERVSRVGRAVVLRTHFNAPDRHLQHNITDLLVTVGPDGTLEEVVCDFLVHYERTGGLTRWGWPISEVIEEQPGVLTQYYQRGVIDCQKREGVWRVERRLVWDSFGGGAAGAPDLGVEPALRSEQPGIELGPWGHRVSNFAVDGTQSGFLAFFEALGGVEAFGYPKTDARYDNDPQAMLGISGAAPGVIRQYFQAAVMEYYPGDPDPVKLRLLGDDLRTRMYRDDTHLLYPGFGSVLPLDVGQVIDPERVLMPLLN